MFGIGIGEIILIILVTFLVAPREIPKVMRKVGEFIAALRHVRNELMNLSDDVREVIGEELPTKNDIFPQDRYREGKRNRNEGDPS